MKRDLCILWGLWFIFSPIVTARDWQVWVCIGQSLMNGPLGETALYSDATPESEILEYTWYLPAEGWQSIRDVRNVSGRTSPAEVFARKMWEYGERDICIIRTSPNGYSIAAFIEESRRLGPKKETNSDLWPTWIDEAVQAMDYLRSQGDTATLRGVIMFQGSSDRASGFYQVYGAQLERLVQDTRDYVDMPDLRWLQIVSPTWTPGHPAVRQLQNSQRSVAASLPYMASAESDNPLGVPLVFSDGTHPTIDGAERIGVVMADAWVESFPNYTTFRNRRVAEYKATGSQSPTIDQLALPAYALLEDLTQVSEETWLSALQNRHLVFHRRVNQIDPLQVDYQFAHSLTSAIWESGREEIEPDQSNAPKGFVRVKVHLPESMSADAFFFRVIVRQAAENQSLD